ncbi:alpha/beta fold hydrolase [Demetria terragena]|uniref:alpha/beta fold hydrolase n=1 Tax=Demetria terragena TaxID=63959 RepID=UPI000368D5A0|nr:alpha/beta fold hydrolase [Demetria terragena]
MKKPRKVTAVVAVSAGAALGAGALGPVGPATAADDVPNVAKLAGKLAKQKIKWSDCTWEDPAPVATVQCATISVPRDWHDSQNGKTLKVEISYNKINEHDEDRFKGAIMGNPGGPGGSGLKMAETLAERAFPDLKPYYNFIGFDPRGTGASEHVSCDYTVDPQDKSAFAKNKAMGEQCADDPDAKVITTEQTTYDMDFIRHLLGLPKLNYFGYSYGSWLGSWYSKVFWSKADLMVLDSALDVTEAAYQHDKEFQPWAGARQQDLFWKSVNKRKAEPSPSRSGQQIDQGSVPAPTATTQAQRDFLNKATNSRSALVRKTASAKINQLDKLTRSSLKRSPGRTATADGQTLTDMGTMIRCGDGQYTQGEGFWQAWIDKLARELNDGKITAGMYREQAVQCLTWKTQNQMPVADPKTYPKTIVIQSELDAQTVWEHGRASGLGLPNTSFIAVDNEAEHGLFPYGTEEVDRPVINFFLQGKLPKADITVAQGRPLDGETQTYEYWKPLNKKAKHYGELVSDPWQPAGTPTIVPVPVRGAEIVEQSQIEGGFEAWVLENYGIKGWNYVTR